MSDDSPTISTETTEAMPADAGIPARFKKRNWYNRKLKKPYEDGGSKIFINWTSSVVDRGLEKEEYISSAVRNKVIATLYDYYGISHGGPNPPLTPSDIKIENIYFPRRALVNPILLLSVKKSDLHGNRVLQRNAGDLPAGPDTYTVNIYVDQIPVYLQNVETAFKIYDQQLTYFQGSITPKISFAGLAKKNKLFFEHLDNFIHFNLPTSRGGARPSDYNCITCTFASTTAVWSEGDIIAGPRQLVGISLRNLDRAGVPIPGTKSRFLSRATQYYFGESKKGNNPYVIEMLHRFDDLANRRRPQLNWTQFVDQYLTSCGIEINYFGPSCTPTVPQQAEQVLWQRRCRFPRLSRSCSKSSRRH